MAQHRKPRYIGYHLMVAGALAVLGLSACTDDPAPVTPMGPTVSSNVEEEPPTPRPEPIPPAEEDEAPASPAAVVQPEPEEDEPVHTGTDRGIYGPEDCDTANTTTPMTQAEWVANCSDWDNSVTTPEEEAHTDGGDGWPEGAYEPAPDECIGYGCSPEQDAQLLEDEVAANADY
jgi:hypothetical protein